MIYVHNFVVHFQNCKILHMDGLSIHTPLRSITVLVINLLIIHFRKGKFYINTTKKDHIYSMLLIKLYKYYIKMSCALLLQ